MKILKDINNMIDKIFISIYKVYEDFIINETNKRKFKAIQVVQKIDVKEEIILLAPLARDDNILSF